MVVITLNSITTLKKNNEETPPTLNLGLTTLNHGELHILVVTLTGIGVS
tara:strand:- start:235 stop:381 length:147 start_codon:yes stop_codon:yes gene_type:complete